MDSPHDIGARRTQPVWRAPDPPPVRVALEHEQADELLAALGRALAARPGLEATWPLVCLALRLRAQLNPVPARA